MTFKLKEHSFDNFKRNQWFAKVLREAIIKYILKIDITSDSSYV